MTPRRQPTTAGHHLDDVHTTINVLPNRLPDPIHTGPCDTSQEMAMTSRGGDRRPRSQQSRHLLLTTQSQRQVATVAQITHSGHPTRQSGPPRPPPGGPAPPAASRPPPRNHYDQRDPPEGRCSRRTQDERGCRPGPATT